MPNKRRTYAIEQFLGTASSQIEGYTKNPVLAKNVSFEIPGAYSPFADLSSGAFGLTTPSLVGYDARLASFIRTSDNIAALYWASGIYTSATAHSYTYGTGEYRAHIPGVGGYAHSNQFLIFSPSRDAALKAEWVSGFSTNPGTPTVTWNNTGGFLPDQYHAYTMLFYFPTDAGKLFYGFTFNGTHDDSAETGDDNSVDITMGTIPGVSRVLVLFKTNATQEGLSSDVWVQAADLDASETVNIDAPPFGYTYEPEIQLMGFRHSVVELHGGRTWGVGSSDDDRWATWAGAGVATSQIFDPHTIMDPLTLIWSRTGTVNLWESSNWLKVPAQNSVAITGLASSPAGLLVYCNNETFLVRGDPDQPASFSIQLLSGVAGHTNDSTYPFMFRPARVGGAVFSVHEGRVIGQSLNVPDLNQSAAVSVISEEIYAFDDRVVQVVTEPSTQSILAMTENEFIYRFHAREGLWSDNAYGKNDGVVTDDIYYMLPGQDANAYDGTEYMYSTTGSVPTNARVARVPSVATDPEEMRVKWSDLDFGDKHGLKLYRAVELTLSSSANTTSFTVTYSVDNGAQSGSLTMDEVTDERWVGYFPAGVVGAKLTLEVRINAGDFGVKWHPPLLIHYSPRRRQWY